MRELYNWHDVAKRTEIVYDRALKCSNQNLLERLSWYTNIIGSILQQWKHIVDIVVIRSPQFIQLCYFVNYLSIRLLNLLVT